MSLTFVFSVGSDPSLWTALHSTQQFARAIPCSVGYPLSSLHSLPHNERAAVRSPLLGRPGSFFWGSTCKGMESGDRILESEGIMWNAAHAERSSKM